VKRAPFIVALLVAACSSGPAAAPPPGPTLATSPDGVPAIVLGPATRYREVTVASSSATAVVPVPLVTAMLPLLVARNLGTPASLAQFGLDHPRATLTFTARDGTSTVVSVGSANFDATGVYMRIGGDGRVFLVLVHALAPVLALAGITLPSAPS
jgi:hypothetical protein